jgi:hypothetical protein
LFLFAASSCKKKIADAQPNLNAEPEPVVKKVFIPVKIVYDRLTTQFDYLPNTSLLKEIRKSTGYRYVFLYNDQQQLSEYRIYQNDKFSYFAQVARNTEGKITKIVKFDVEPVYQQSYYPRGQYTLEFDHKNQLSKILDFGADKKLIWEKTLEYDDAGNMTKISTDEAGIKTRADLSYDSKNGIYKNISFMPVVFVLHQDADMLGNGNNILSYSQTLNTEDDRLVTYDYNTDNYPSKMMVTRKSWKETHLVTYIEISLP